MIAHVVLSLLCEGQRPGDALMISSAVWLTDLSGPISCRLLQLANLHFQWKHSELTSRNQRSLLNEAACHCNNSPLSAERSGSMLINELGSESSPGGQLPLSPTPCLWEFLNGGWSQEKAISVNHNERAPSLILAPLSHHSPFVSRGRSWSKSSRG